MGKNLIFNDKTKIKNDNNKIKVNKIKNRNTNINNYNIIIRKCLKITLIKSIIINIFCRNIILNLFYFRNSKITLKIKGVGESQILGNDTIQNFKDLKYLKEIFINGIKQDKIEYKYSFNQTVNFVELIWDDNIINCRNMFFKCSNISEIDLSNFNTSQVTNMDYMLYGCSSLTSLNLSNFNTLQVTNMDSMFRGCSLLTSLNLSNFNTSQVTNKDYMFRGCSLLTSLNLSNFNTSKVKNKDYMFYGCSSLEYINLINFKETGLNFSSIFQKIPENVVICVNNKISEYIKNYPMKENHKCLTIDCSDDWKSKQKKIINNTNECIERCDNSPIYKYEYNGKCYDNCSNGFLLDKNNNRINKCKCELDKCLLCPNVALKKNLCTKCNINYYPKENDPLNLGEYINCYKAPEGYYLHNNTYKQCFYT